jgi:general secretion pathway protein J
MKQHRGFTLLELLVSLSIVALVSVMAYGGLRSVLQTGQHVEQQAGRMQQLQTALLIIGRDLQQIQTRGIRDEYGDLQPPVRAKSLGPVHLEFTRAGWNNPAGLPRSNLQRIAYAHDQGELRRLAWRVLDRAQDSQPHQAPLLDGVSTLRWRYLDASREWREQWPDDLPGSFPVAASQLPLAIELRLELDDLGEFRRLFVLPQPAAAANMGDGP